MNKKETYLRWAKIPGSSDFSQVEITDELLTNDDLQRIRGEYERYGQQCKYYWPYSFALADLEPLSDKEQKTFILEYVVSLLSFLTDPYDEAFELCLKFDEEVDADSIDYIVTINLKLLYETNNKKYLMKFFEKSNLSDDQKQCCNELIAKIIRREASVKDWLDSPFYLDNRMECLRCSCAAKRYHQNYIERIEDELNWRKKLLDDIKSYKLDEGKFCQANANEPRLDEFVARVSGMSSIDIENLERKVTALEEILYKIIHGNTHPAMLDAIREIQNLRETEYIVSRNMEIYEMWKLMTKDSIMKQLDLFFHNEYMNKDDWSDDDCLRMDVQNCFVRYFMFCDTDESLFKYQYFHSSLLDTPMKRIQITNHLCTLPYVLPFCEEYNIFCKDKCENPVINVKQIIQAHDNSLHRDKDEYVDRLYFPLLKGKYDSLATESNKLKELGQRLSERGYISESCVDLFIYRFSGIGETHDETQKIEWKYDKEEGRFKGMLPNMISYFCRNSSNKYKSARPPYQAISELFSFVDKHGNQIKVDPSGFSNMAAHSQKAKLQCESILEPIFDPNKDY